MMRDWDRIEHMLGAIGDVLASTDGITFEQFLDNKDKRAAAERYMMIIGEAAHMVSGATRVKYPNVEWHRMSAMRNMIAHEYMRVDYSALWVAIRQFLPQVRIELEKVKKDIPPPPAA